jgi:hypothetical protein
VWKSSGVRCLFGSVWPGCDFLPVELAAPHLWRGFFHPANRAAAPVLNLPRIPLTQPSAGHSLAFNEVGQSDREKSDTEKGPGLRALFLFAHPLPCANEGVKHPLHFSRLTAA